MLPLLESGTAFLKQHLKNLNKVIAYRPAVKLARLLLISLVAFILSSADSNKKAKLVVKVTNIESTKGVVEIGLYSDNGKFPIPNKQYKSTRQKITSSEVKYTFQDLPVGKYALAVYHDENEDKKCNKNFFGVPTEAYCFSRDFRPFLSIPKFKDCAINLNGDRMISIKMVY